MRLQLIAITCTASLALFSCNSPIENPTKGNLLKNPSFELQLENWVAEGSVETLLGDPAPHEGSAYIFGKKTAKFRLHQKVNITENGFFDKSIDSGKWSAKFGGFQSGFKEQTDYGVISLIFLNSSGSQIGKESLDSFYSNHTWVEKSGIVKIPSGTRSIIYEFIGTRQGEGEDCDAYLDSAYLEIIENN
jgi:hypothetical protein